MHVFRKGLIVWLMLGPCLSFGQDRGFNSFITRVAAQYKVDVAIAPELIPILDSLRDVGTEIKTVEELLHRLLNRTGISYQIVDGNKVMLRSENPDAPVNQLAILRGMIQDQQSGDPLPYATVVVAKSNAYCHTDENGQFILPIPDTSGTVQINYLGYKPLTLPVKSFLAGNVMVEMETQKMPLEEVLVIVPYRLMTQDYSGQSTDLKGYQFISETQLLSWNAERLITSLTTYTHFSSDHGIRIRGSEAVNSLILMDDIPVYDPYHFYNIFGPFNRNYFTSVEVFKNNLPIEYGGRIDGLIQVKSDREKPKSKLILDTDLLQTAISTELVLSPEIYFTAGARTSHTGILNEALSDSTVTNFSFPGKFQDNNEWSTSQQPESDFYDINLGLSIQPGTNSNISLHYFDSRDQLDNTTRTNFETSIFNQEIISVQQTYKSDDEWKNRGFSAGFTTKLGSKTSLKLKAFHATFQKEVRYTSLFKEVRQGMLRTNNHFGLQQSDLSTTGIKGFVHQEINTRADYTIGIELQNHDVDFMARENNTPILRQSQKEKEIILFGEYSNTLWDRVEWSVGNRLTHLQSTSGTYFLPNLFVYFPIDEKFSLRTSFSKNIQSVHELTVENRFGRELDYLVLSEPEENYSILKSNKFMFGAGFTSTYFSMDAEMYYKESDGLARVRALRPDPSHDDPTTPDDFYQLFSGEGWTTGMDLTILYKRNKMEASLLYTLSKIQERYEMLYNGNYFSPQEDRRHQIKIAGSYTFGKFQASTLLTYKSKAPYLSLVRLEGQDGIGMVNQRAVQRYLPPYFSLDLGLDYTFTLFKQPAMIGLSLINSTNHENINDLQHIGKVSRDGERGLFVTSQTELLGRTGNIHFRYLIQ